MREYCLNDLNTTTDLWHKLQSRLQLRETMGAEFGLDLRSKSDAKIAEGIIRSEVERSLGQRVYRPELHPDYAFQYRAPAWVAFSGPGMVQALDLIHAQTFTLLQKDTRDNKAGSVLMPHLLDGLRIRIGQGVYRMGIGGLHSSEKSVSHVADGHTGLWDVDVTSYYPRLMTSQGMTPPALGEVFCPVFDGIVTRRTDAKAAGNKALADGLKIPINGTFGKMGSKWSVLYAPNLMIQVTLTGQLAMLMLIEAIEAAGIPVVSANTDGIVIKCPRHRKDELAAIVMAWEWTTSLQTEETEYKALYSRDVNNYIAIKPDGSYKLKGVYATGDIGKNVSQEIVTRAAVLKLTENAPVGLTVRACDDVRKFLCMKKVEGGGVWNGQYLGKAVRWYYAAGEVSHIAYASNGNKVGSTDGARPLMELPDALPADIDYDYYIREAQAILQEVGA